jgi:Flp pilus assembly pilin Flp
LTEAQFPGGPDVAPTSSSSVRTCPIAPLYGPAGVCARAGWRDSASGHGSLARQQGQGLVEYGLILVIVAVVCVVSLVFFGDQLSSLLQLITGAV